jgi:hypothetical protein
MFLTTWPYLVYKVTQPRKLDREVWRFHFCRAKIPCNKSRVTYLHKIQQE